jgi:metal-sulfur cluster biosynthetic enzyme
MRDIIVKTGLIYAVTIVNEVGESVEVRVLMTYFLLIGL